MGHKIWILTACLASSSLTPAFASDDTGKGLLPEVRIGAGDTENDNDRKALTSEILITRSENKAIEALQRLIKEKKPDSPVMPDLLYRLAELYMRRSKSGRFFDMNQNNPVLKKSAFPIPNEKGTEAIKRAMAVYARIEHDYPHFKDMDEVLFNEAFALQQLGKGSEASAAYARLVERFPKSPMVPDGTLALGELLYEQGKFPQALDQFLKLEHFPKSRVYSYGMYKAAWAYYNMKDSDHGIQKLVAVVNFNPPLQEGQVATNRQNLRQEALRDLTVFVEASYSADRLYEFFAKLCAPNELGPSMIDLAKLYEAHSRQKEMGTFLNEFIEKNPTHAMVLKANIFLVNAYEDLKQRDKVINHLQASSDLCKSGSSWRTVQTPEVASEACDQDFRRTSLEIAKKWWDIWLKNKQNVAFSDLTEKSFRLILDNEDPAKPDLKTHFALAELLFQLGKYDEASSEYKFVGQRADEPTMQHDASYGALYSVEKSIEKSKAKDKDPAKEALRKELAVNYLTKNPNGKYAQNVRFKLGAIAYEANDFPESQKWLQPIADSGKDPELKRKAEDLILDMLNIKKDYGGLQKMSKKILSNGSNDDRKKNMNKIYEEARYAEIQDLSKTADAPTAARKLLDFAKEHEDSPLAKESLWQALSLLYSNGRVYEAAELSVQYAKKYPNDKKAMDALKDAAKSYADIGQLQKASETLKVIAELDKKNAPAQLELAADFARLEGHVKDARDMYTKLMTGTDSKNQARLTTKIIATYGGNTSSPDYQRLQEKMLASNIEPYATQILQDRADKLMAAGKKTEAFEMARKIMNRSIPKEDKAAARLIQAQVLESELISQSMKAKIEKIPVVLSLKTEKLGKAQTAYLDALALSKEEKIVRKALAGLDRCYTNYITSLTNMPYPPSLSPDEKETLKGELAKITTPIQAKKTENETRLKSLVVARATADNKERDFSELSPETSIVPLVSYPTVSQFEPYLTAKVDMSPIRVQKAQAKQCQRSFALKDAKIQGILENANACFLQKQYDITEKHALELAKFKDTRVLGLYYLSLTSENHDLKEKAMWLIDQLIKTQPENGLVLYQKGRLTYQLEDINAAIPFFAKVIDMNIGSSEIATFAAVKAFTEKDYIQAADNFSHLTQDQVYTYNMGSLFSESYALSGETEKALQLITDLSAKKKDNVDLLLEQAHLLETYKSDAANTMQIYDKVSKLTTKMDLKDWITKKVEFLKGQSKIGSL